MIEVKVWGDYALFSRPGFKVERVSYPIITPSAARGVLEAIFWKPEIRYEVREIWVLNQGSRTSILRNELSDRQGREPYFVEDKRQQRTSLILKNVEYVIRAEVICQSHTTESLAKYLSQFEQRVERGQYYHAPYLGTREFAASFEPVTAEDKPNESVNVDIGTMLLDVAFVENKTRAEMEFHKHGDKGALRVKGYAQAVFFNAKVERGKLTALQEKYEALRALEAGRA